MHLALLIAAVLSAESVEGPALVEPPKPEERVTLSNSQARLLGLGIGSVLLGSGAAIGAWADRDGTFGRVCAITAGTLGTALLTASLAALISSFIWPAAPEGTTVSGVASEMIEDTGRFIAMGIVTMFAGLAGLAGGAVMSAFVSAPTGTQRGLLGVAGGGVMVATSITVLLLAW
jgi:hypothetical protein